MGVRLHFFLPGQSDPLEPKLELNGKEHKVCVSRWKGKYTVDDSPLGLSIPICAVDEMTHHCGKGYNPLCRLRAHEKQSTAPQVMKQYSKFHS